MNKKEYIEKINQLDLENEDKITWDIKIKDKTIIINYNNYDEKFVVDGDKTFPGDKEVKEYLIDIVNKLS